MANFPESWWQNKKQPLIFAHRGASLVAPENTIAAFHWTICTNVEYLISATYIFFCPWAWFEEFTFKGDKPYALLVHIQGIWFLLRETSESF